MAGRLTRFSALLFLIFLGTGAQAALHKIALIIANTNYASGNSLRNPVKDADLIAESLRAAGFDSVQEKLQLTRPQFDASLREFKQQAAEADVALIYYAGHGIEFEGKNWMIPVDADLKEAAELQAQAVNLDDIATAIRFAKMRIVILDACRDNPFSRSWISTTRGQSPAGLAMSQLDNYVVIYSAGPGQTATDGEGGNSPFALSLAKRLTQPDLPIQLLGNYVRDDVIAATGGVQHPFFSASVTANLVFLNQSNSVLLADQAKAAGASGLELTVWREAVRANTAESYAAFQAQFPQSRLLKLVDVNRKRLTIASRSLNASGAAAAQPDPASVLTARLNDSVQAHNDEIALKHNQDMDVYQKRIDVLKATSDQIQDDYLKKVQAFKDEEVRWQQRAVACRTSDVKKCAESADPSAAGSGGGDPKQIVTWNEAIVVCVPPDVATVMTSRCEGPLGEGLPVLGTEAGFTILVKLCGGPDLHDLGRAGEKRIFGCGFGVHPEDNVGRRKGNLDVAAKFGLNDLPGRATFHCSRDTPDHCRKS